MKCGRDMTRRIVFSGDPYNMYPGADLPFFRPFGGSVTLAPRNTQKQKKTIKRRSSEYMIYIDKSRNI